MKKLKVGIIGQGRSGRDIHRQMFTNVPSLQERYEVVAVADYIAERRKFPGAVEGEDFLSTDNYKEILARKDIDLVINATRSMDHIPVSIECLEAGKNLICEKPLARCVADIEKLEAAVKKSGKFFAPFQQSRFRPIFKKALEVMNSGVLGRIIMVKVAYNGYGRRWDWQTLQDMNAGELLNTGPHPMDQVVQFLGEKYPENIHCIMDRVNTFGDAEDHVKILLHGKDVPTIDVEISRCCMFPGNTYEIYGSKGGLKASGNNVTWRYFKPEDEVEQKLIREPLEKEGRLPCYCSENVKFYDESWTAPDCTGTMNFWGECYYKQVYDALVNGRKMEINLDQVKTQIRIIEECHRQNPFPRLPAE